MTKKNKVDPNVQAYNSAVSARKKKVDALVVEIERQLSSGEAKSASEYFFSNGDIISPDGEFIRIKYAIRRFDSETIYIGDDLKIKFIVDETSINKKDLKFVNLYIEENNHHCYYGTEFCKYFNSTVQFANAAIPEVNKYDYDITDGTMVDAVLLTYHKSMNNIISNLWSEEN